MRCGETLSSDCIDEILDGNNLVKIVRLMMSCQLDNRQIYSCIACFLEWDRAYMIYSLIELQQLSYEIIDLIIDLAIFGVIDVYDAFEYLTYHDRAPVNQYLTESQFDKMFISVKKHIVKFQPNAFRRAIKNLTILSNPTIVGQLFSSKLRQFLIMT